MERKTIIYLSNPNSAPSWRSLYGVIERKHPFALDLKIKDDIIMTYRFFNDKTFEVKKFLELLYDSDFALIYFIMALLENRHFDKLVQQFKEAITADYQEKLLTEIKKSSIFFTRYPQARNELILIIANYWQKLADILNIKSDISENNASVLVEKIINMDISIITLVSAIDEIGISPFADKIAKIINSDIKNIGYDPQKFGITRTIQNLGSQKITVEMEYTEWSKYLRWRDSQKHECVVCMNGPQECVFMPCRHQIVCEQCQMLLTLCPYCRQHIKEKIIPING